MYRRAAACRKALALWMGKPLARHASRARLSAPRPKIPPLIKFPPGRIKYTSSELPKTWKEYELMEAPSFDLIRSRMTCTEFVDSVWGFAVYRCAGTDESAWKRMIQHISGSVDETLNYYGQEDLRSHHDLHVMDERPSEDSHHASARQVRDHFQSWVSQSLAARLLPNTETDIEDLAWTGATWTPRYEFCLLVDSLCLESLDQSGLNLPVVKLICRDWGDPLTPEERQSAVVYPGFHDGVTEYHEEDVGWMYMPVSEYVNWYGRLHDSVNGWDGTYVRPPYLYGYVIEDDFIGSWRRG